MIDYEYIKIIDYEYMKIILSVFFALSYVFRIWRSSVTVFIVSNMMFLFVFLHELKEDAIGYNIITVCMIWIFYRALCKKPTDQWKQGKINIQLKDD